MSSESRANRGKVKGGGASPKYPQLAGLKGLDPAGVFREATLSGVFVPRSTLGLGVNPVVRLEPEGYGHKQSIP